MRVPLSWLCDFVDPGVPVERLGELLTFAGLEVEAIHRPSAGVRGVRVAEVRSVDKIEGSDKLHLVEAYDGEQTQAVVCGAANYTPGDRVAWAQPGATLPGGVEIGRKKLFGVTSNGMLASARELGVGDEHRGIWVLDADAPLGADVAEWLDLDDPVLEVKVNPDRGYANAILGVARDVAALTGAPLHVPESQQPEGDPQVPVRIEQAARCPRFDIARMIGVRVGPSPAWMRRRLAAAGVRAISNLVDATNYTMLETGHPVHAYDLRRLAGPRLDVRSARPDETLTTLDGSERRLDPDDLVIADADGPVGLAGVMGGERTEVDETTQEVLLEVASFEPASVLRTARRHKLFTQASARFEKTVPADTVPLAMTRCVALVAATAAGRLQGWAAHQPAPPRRPVIRLRPARARGYLGMDVDDARQRALLEALGCTVQPLSGTLAREGAPADTPTRGTVLEVTPPAYRPDLGLEVDLYEEIARLHGYDQVPERLPGTGQAGGRTAAHDARRAVRETLAGGGWSEVVTFPFIDDEDLERLGLARDDRRRRTIGLVNPLSKEESVLRTTLLPGLLRVVRHNVNRQITDVAVFEVGHVFLPPTPQEPAADGGPGGVVLPAEPLRLGLAACGNFDAPRHDRRARAVDFYDLAGAADLVRAAVGGATLEARPTRAAPFHPGRAARLLLDGVDVGVVGELHPRVAEAYDLPARTLAGELALDPVVHDGIRPAVATLPSPLPGLRFDVAVMVDEVVPAAAVEATVRAGAGERTTSCTLFDVYRGASIGQGRKSLAYTLRLDDPQRQLTDVDEAAAIEGIAQAVAAIGAELRR